MIAEIVSVGTELLMGQIVNTDAQFIASHLAPLGYRVLYQVTVGDNPARLAGVVQSALARADVLLLTGASAPRTTILPKRPSRRRSAWKWRSYRKKRRACAPILPAAARR